MGMNLNALAGKTAKTEVQFMGQTAKIVYDPMVLTQANMEKWQTTRTDGAVIEFFLDLVKSWDVTKGQKKVPLTTAGVKGVPMQLVRACIRAVMTDGGTDAEEGKDSSDG